MNKNTEKGIAQYAEQAIRGKSPVELVITVYAGAIATLNEAEEALTRDDRESCRERLERTKKFITHLYGTLDFAQGGEVAENLGKLYTFMIEKIMVAQATYEIETIVSVREILQTLKSAWDSIRTDLEKQLTAGKGATKTATPNTSTDDTIKLKTTSGITLKG